MNMTDYIDSLLQLDKLLFHYINGVWRSDYADIIMPFMRNAKNWLPLYFILLIALFYTYKSKGISILIFVVLSAASADVISSHVIKPNIHRIRPCNDITLKGEVINIVPCGSGYSFTSSHAANHVAFAIAISLTLFRKRRSLQILICSWALTIAYAQVYVGVHYPLDITFGALLGAFVANGWYWLFKKKQLLDF